MHVYLDHAATGPLHPAAVEAMRPWLGERFGNPSGSHRIARQASEAVESAREVIAGFLGVDPGGVVFTSGGTEADNLAVLGPLGHRLGAVVVSAVEHHAVIEAAHASDREVRIAPVGADGIVDVESLRALLDRAAGDVAVVSIQLVNNETGVMQPLAALARRVHKWAPGAVFHTDAVQGAPWLDLAASCAGADLVSISGHKFGGPQGVGALGVRNGVALAPILHGGGQERERRSGTHNVAGIVGLAAAVEAITPEPGREERWTRTAALRDRLTELIAGALPDVIVTAAESERTPGHCHIRIPGVESEELLFLLDQNGVYASAGSACASGALEPSPVLLAMGVSKEEAASSLRLTLGPGTRPEEVEYAAGVVRDAAVQLRAHR